MDFIWKILGFFVSLWNSFPDDKKEEIINKILDFFAEMFSDFYDECNDSQKKD